MTKTTEATTTEATETVPDYVVELNRDQCVALASCLSTEDARPLLQSAILDDSRVAATQGHMLVQYQLTPTDENARTPEDMPKGFSLTMAALKACKASSFLRLNLTTRAVQVVGKKGLDIQATLPDLEEQNHFPDIDRIVPREVSEVRFALSRVMLERLAKAARKGERYGKANAITFEIVETGDVTRAIRIRDAGAEMSGVVMPCRVA